MKFCLASAEFASRAWSRHVDADNHDKVIAIPTGSGVSLGDLPPGFYAVDNPVNYVADSPDPLSLADVSGIVESPDHTRVIEKVIPMMASLHAPLHQGPINFALEAAAMDELERITGTNSPQVEHYTRCCWSAP